MQKDRVWNQLGNPGEAQLKAIMSGFEQQPRFANMTSVVDNPTQAALCGPLSTTGSMFRHGRPCPVGMEPRCAMQRHSMHDLVIHNATVTRVHKHQRTIPVQTVHSRHHQVVADVCPRSRLFVALRAM